MGPANLYGISCVMSKNENNSNVVVQMTSAEFEAGAEAGLASLDRRKPFQFSTRASALLPVMIISHHPNAALR